MTIAELAYEIDLPRSRERQVCFVGQDSEEAALATLSTNSALLPEPRLRIVRVFNAAAINEFKVQRGGISGGYEVSEHAMRFERCG